MTSNAHRVPLTPRPAEGVHRGAGTDVDEPRVLHEPPPGIQRLPAGDAVGPQVDVAGRLVRHGPADRDVGERELHRRGEATRDLAKAAALSATRLSTPLEITTSAQPSSTGRSSASPSRNSTLARPSCRAVARALASISGVMSTPDDSAGSAHQVRGDERVEPGAGARPRRHGRPAPRGRSDERVRHPGERLHRPVRQAVDQLGVVAERRGERSSGVEVELAGRWAATPRYFSRTDAAQRLGVDDESIGSHVGLGTGHTAIHHGTKR